MPTTTPGRTFYDRQVAYLEAKDVDGLVASQYHADAVIVGFDFTRQGSEALRDHFVRYLDHLGSITLVSTDKFTEISDAIFFEATVRVAHGEARVYDVFMLRAGKATHHFTGLLSFTPNAAPAATGADHGR
jgi:hypothetical protein